MGQQQSSNEQSGQHSDISQSNSLEPVTEPKFKCYLTSIPSHVFEFIDPDSGSCTTHCKTCGIDRTDFQHDLQSKLMDPTLNVHVHIWDQNNKCIGTSPASDSKPIPVCDLDRDETKLNYEVYKGVKKTVIEYTPVDYPVWKKEVKPWF